MACRHGALETVAVKPLLFNGIYKDTRVLVTGHTGFKGSWLTFWLLRMGARVAGVSLPPETHPNHFDLLGLSGSQETGDSAYPHQHIQCDVRDMAGLQKAVGDAGPEIVFHLAAQPLVRRSYREPAETFATNVQGTVNLLEACRKTDTVRAIVVITSDKCYENKEWVWGYRESDPMGGYDPYSASKGCAELVAASWRNAFFHPDQYGQTHHTLLASARAGNVIGGGDWSEDRLIPDIVRAAANGRPVVIRNPDAVRPWQHVLEPLAGYLLLGRRLLEGKKEFAQAWNFGPGDDGCIAVGEVVRRCKAHWDAVDYELTPNVRQPHEANLLKLDCAKARSVLNWRPVWGIGKTIEKTVQWYKNYDTKNSVSTQQDLDAFLEDAANLL